MEQLNPNKKHKVIRTPKTFFISYASPDEKWAVWVAWHLEKHGFKTIIQAWDFRPGKNFLHKMHEASAEACATIAIISTEYFERIYTEAEWMAAVAQDIDGEQRKLIPVRIEDIKLPGIISGIICIDIFKAETEQSALKILLKGISYARAKPKERPSYPLAEDKDKFAFIPR